MRFHRLFPAEDLTEGRPVAVEVEGRPLFLVRSGDSIHALDDLCPHSGSRLHPGRVRAGVVACPLHGGRFDLATGRCLTPQLGGVGDVVVHAVRIVESQVEVALAERPITPPLT
jgi:3-phenylpropionate/trans-cinnamate dioxygenase ferredoxin subunit